MIREIKTKDDGQVAKLIRAVLVEMGVPKVGTAYADKALDEMTKGNQAGANNQANGEK